MKAKFIFFIILSNIIALAAIPNWFISDISEERLNYFIGKGFATIQNGNILEAENKAKQEALKDASATISCNVTGETINHSSETGIGKKAKVEEYFLSETKVITDLEIMGYKVLKIEKDKRNVYTLIGIPIEDLINTYKNKITTNIKQISEVFEFAENQAESNPKLAINKYEECNSLTSMLQEDLKIYLFLNNWQNDFINDLNLLPSKQKIENKLSILDCSTPKSSETLANDLLQPLLSQHHRNYSFVFYPFEYENTGFISSYGKNFAEICSGIIINKYNWEILQFTQYQSADIVFRGKILESDKGMFLNIQMQDPNDKVIQSNQLFANEVTCENIGWDNIKPENLEQALENKLALYNAIQTDYNLKIELQTDKMSDGPIIYYYGEEPEIYVRTNKSCFIRIIYIFSDETKILLIDNYPIATDQANQWVQIPFKGVICEPSGVEQLILQASTEKQPFINYRRENIGANSYIDIIDSDIGSQIAKTRGIKLSKPKKEITEKVVQWTVFEK